MPAEATATLQILIESLAHFKAQIGRLDAEISRCAEENEVARLLMKVPGIDPLIAAAIATLTPPTETFRQSLTFLALLGLVLR